LIEPERPSAVRMLRAGALSCRVFSVPDFSVLIVYWALVVHHSTVDGSTPSSMLYPCVRIMIRERTFA